VAHPPQRLPDDLMYTLIINDAIIGKFHDWPEAWQ
jgi:hypothetical protein